MKRTQAWFPLVFAIVLIVGMVTGYKLREKTPISQGFFDNNNPTSVQEAMDLIRLHYVDSVKIDTLTDDAIQAMLSHLDPHSVFIPAKYLQQVNEDLQGNFEGIGVEFQIINDTVNVVNVLPGGPSKRSGIKVGDKFLKVEDSAVAGNHISAERIKALLRGTGGSKVNITLLSDRVKKTLQVQRGTIPLYSVDATYMVDSVTGFIHLNKFSGTSYEEVMNALEKLQKQGMKKLILDLRDNGGGILGEAIDIADEFLDEDKLIVFTKGDKQKKVEYRSKRPGLFEKGDLTLLVDEGSASASEVLAGALQDWDRATIIGRRTFGKGLVQEQYALSGGSALRLTVARYYTPAGRSIQKSYSNGRSAYNEEVLERFHNGETLHADTLKVALGTAYKTNSGRIVYGGGGITPDIFIPYDTASFPANAAALFANQYFGKFIYRYYIRDKNFFDQFRDPVDFNLRFNANAETWKALTAYIRENNIQLSALNEKDRTEIEKRIKSGMARQIWGINGYYQVINKYDKTVLEARKILGTK